MQPHNIAQNTAAGVSILACTYAIILIFKQVSNRKSFHKIILNLLATSLLFSLFSILSTINIGSTALYCNAIYYFKETSLFACYVWGMLIAQMLKDILTQKQSSVWQSKNPKLFR